MSIYEDKHKEVIIITEHFAPSIGATAQLVTDLAEDLNQMGVRIRVITSTASTADVSFPVHRFSGIGGRSVGVFQKATRGLYFFICSTLWLAANLQNHQSLFIVSNPPFIGLIGVLFSIIKGTRYVFLFQDVFPRSASLTGILPAQGPLISFWRALLKLVLTRSETTVVLSGSMVRRCKIDFGSSLCLACIPNWAVLPSRTKPKHQSQLTAAWGVENTFTVQYSGNFGRLHDILTILEAARLLQDQPIKFVFIGAGAKSSQILRYCNVYALTNVEVKPYLPRHLLADGIAACDLAIVSLIPGAEDTVAPSKFYGIIASARPVILLSSPESELASIVHDSQCGITVPQGDVLLLSESITLLKANPDLVSSMGINARRLYEGHYGRSRSASQYYQLLSRNSLV